MTTETQARLAEMLQNNPLWKETLADLRDKNVEAWKAQRDRDEQFKFWVMNQALNLLESKIDEKIKEAQLVV